MFEKRGVKKRKYWIKGNYVNNFCKNKVLLVLQVESSEHKIHYVRVGDTRVFIRYIRIQNYFILFTLDLSVPTTLPPCGLLGLIIHEIE